jgi:putative glutamine amidotransferase
MGYHTFMQRRPRIGIPMRIDYPTERFYLARHYSEAVEAAGGAPVHVSLIPRAEYIDAVVDGLEGILLPGSDSDVDPLRYGQQPHPALGSVHKIKDETDLLIIDAAERRQLPLFAICFGMQVLNVSRGGTLIQDIRSQVPNAIKHEQGAPRERPSHNVSVPAGSKLNQIINTEDLLVNSHHHQAIETLGADLIATAWSSDGVIEAFEDPRGDRFVIAVQWHPEMGWQNDQFSQRLFDSFVAHARERVDDLSAARV